MQNNTQDSWEEEFDASFPLEYFANTEFPYNYKETPMEWQLLNWQEQETKKAKGRKEFLKSFIRQLLSKQAEEISEAVKFLGKEQIESYKGKLPFVVCGGKADEQEKIAIYRQALNDALLAIKQVINK